MWIIVTEDFCKLPDLLTYGRRVITDVLTGIVPIDLPMWIIVTEDSEKRAARCSGIVPIDSTMWIIVTEDFVSCYLTANPWQERECVTDVSAWSQSTLMMWIIVTEDFCKLLP
ncbi:hypothetical protein AVEN_3694-1 [Araneus ventricosus]|uniref:Uncharacterized protein n=1 Tax=Araneus ventricosus TaxID=182803 RepID=A0A4Y2MWP9_ARAVE|nr:hypothetical protein AVEN_3694-1 [Araneus ventricosus]